MFTTSRYASLETRQTAKKMAIEKGEPFLARGKKTIAQLASVARKKGEERISIVEERLKKPDAIVIIKISETGKWAWVNETKM